MIGFFVKGIKNILKSEYNKLTYFKYNSCLVALYTFHFCHVEFFADRGKKIFSAASVTRIVIYDVTCKPIRSSR